MMNANWHTEVWAGGAACIDVEHIANITYLMLRQAGILYLH